MRLEGRHSPNTMPSACHAYHAGLAVLQLSAAVRLAFAPASCSSVQPHLRLAAASYSTAVAILVVWPTGALRLYALTCLRSG